MDNANAPDGTAFDVTGNRNNHTLALIHGLGLSRSFWQPYVKSLSQHYCVVNYDLYGHGDSAPFPTNTSLQVYANQLANLLDHLSMEHVSIIGFSIGGMINRRFALDYPHKVSSLVILNSPHERGEKAQKQVEARAATVGTTGAMATLDDALVRWFTPAYRAQNASSLNSVRRWREQADAESYAQAAWVLANGVRELIAPTPPISAPTLVMTSENDSGSTPAMSVSIAGEINNAKLIVVPALQHLGLMENSEAFINPIMTFLNEHLN